MGDHLDAAPLRTDCNHQAGRSFPPTVNKKSAADAASTQVIQQRLRLSQVGRANPASPRRTCTSIVFVSLHR
jgi:hypothetical protein